MEVSIPIDFINPTNVYFVEKKKNIIVEGDFVKVIYSTDSFEMNGVYIAIDFFTFPKGACVIKSIPSSHRLWTEVNPDADFEFESRNALTSAESTPKPQNNLKTDQIRGFPDYCEVREGRKSEINTKCSIPMVDRGISNENVTESTLDKSWIQIINKTQQYRDFSSQKRTEDTENVKIDTSRNTKKIIVFDSNSKENKLLIEKLCRFENDIIKRYIDENCPKKTATYILKNQLMTNTVKYHSENKEFVKKINNVERCILKVSGLWETATNVGITMKFTLVY